LKKALGKAEQEVQPFTGALAALGSSHTNGQRTLSASARRRISLAQKEGWATARKESKPAAAAAPAKRTMSASARRKIAAAQKKNIAMGSTGYVLRCFSIRLRLPMVMGFDSAVDIISQITGTSSRIRNSVWQCSQLNLPASM